MKTTTQTHYYKIIRRTSPYNKYIKWFVELYLQGGKCFSSHGYKTRQQAEQSLTHNKPMPIGNRLVKAELVQIYDIEDAINAGFTLEPIKCRCCGYIGEVTIDQNCTNGICGVCGEWQLDE